MAGKKQKETKEKPLEKMTATELRELAKGIDGITGVHGMNKAELISAVKQARGIVETKSKNACAAASAVSRKRPGGPLDLEPVVHGSGAPHRPGGGGL